MSNPPIPAYVLAEQNRRRRKRRRLLLTLACMIVLAIVAVVGGYFYLGYLARQDLEAAIAETDRLDPGWRFEDIEKGRAGLPDEQNAALPIRQATAMIVTGWTTQITPKDPPQHQLDPERIEVLRKAVQPLLPAAALAQKAVPLKKGWYQMPAKAEDLRDFNPMDVGLLGRFLGDVAALQIQDGKHDKALETILALLAIARSFGDESSLLPAWLSPMLRTIAVMSLERCLAQGKGSDSLLAQAQQVMAEEAVQPIFFHAMRGERARVHMRMTDIESGKIDFAQLFGDGYHTTEVRFEMYLAGSTIEKEHAWMLRHFNATVEYAKLPPAEMLAKLQTLKQAETAPPLARIMASWYGFEETAVRTRAELECAAAAIAVERYRMQQGRWPDSLE